MRSLSQESAGRFLALCLTFSALGFGVGWYAHQAPPCPPAPAPIILPATTLDVDTANSLKFVASIKKGIADNPRIRPAMAKKLQAVLDGPDSAKKSIVLRVLERHAKAHLMEQHLAIGATVETFDWSKVNWTLVLDTILKILILILPLL